ncbi:MAG: hypothetical protein NWF09_06325 [Candidatus Bathyarchaeota archaeon]|nr:hypothetical protein [Candidatus Bathyarchaeota archaeon]
MRSRVRKSRRTRLDKEQGVRLQKRVIEERFEVLEIVSLRDVPLEERRKEAEKPLFLIRYE